MVVHVDVDVDVDMDVDVDGINIYILHHYRDFRDVDTRTDRQTNKLI